MANRLHRDIKKGEVLIANEHFAFEATGGFGLSASTSGSALFGTKVNGKSGDFRDYKLRAATEEEAQEYWEQRPIQTRKTLEEHIAYLQGETAKAEAVLAKFNETGILPVGY